jgi:hypothetical protein
MFDEIVRSSRNSIVVAAFLLLLSVYLTLYTWRAHAVASRHILEDSGGEVVAWRTGPSGSLFPWPREPGMLEVLSKINEVDFFIYRCLIKTWLLVGLSILLWVCAGLCIFKATRTDVKGKKLLLINTSLASASSPFITLISGLYIRTPSSLVRNTQRMVFL